MNKENFFNLLDEKVLGKLLEDSEYLEQFRKSIELKNKDSFKKLIEDNICRGISILIEDEENLKFILNRKIRFYLAGYHYISFSQGSWFRFIGIEDKMELNALEWSYYEQILNLVPKESNLFTNNILKNPIQLQFGGEKQNYYPCLSIEDLRNLKKCLAKVNLLKYIAKMPVEKEKSSNDSAIIDDIIEKLSKYLIELKNYLNKNISDETKDIFNSKDWKRKLLELFIFSFFPTIYSKFFDSSNERPLYVLIFPYKWQIKNNKNEINLVKYATFGGSYTSDNNYPLNRNQVSILNRYLQIIPLFVLSQEYSISWDIIEPSTLIIEDVIRQCAYIDSEVQKKVNRWNKKFKNLFEIYNFKDNL
jgi:hypothetical protein